MHIWNNIKDFLYDQNNFMAMYNKTIYIYNFNRLVTLNNKNIIVIINNQEVKITGDDLKVLKCSNNEIIVQGNLKEIKYFE